MNPSHNPGSSGFEQPPVVSQVPEASLPVPESLPAVAAEAAPQPGMAAPTGQPAAWLPPTVPVQSASDAAVPATPAPMVAVPAVADDGDVIEKEWVVKAKQIVERTRQDPHLQTKEMHKFKAEYMKKRYNKVIEAVEE